MKKNKKVKQGLAFSSAMTVGAMVIAAPVSSIAFESKSITNEDLIPVGEETLLDAVPSDSFKINVDVAPSNTTLSWEKINDINSYLVVKMEKVDTEYVVVEDIVVDTNSFQFDTEVDEDHKYRVAPIADGKVVLAHVGEVFVDKDGNVTYGENVQNPVTPELTDDQIQQLKQLATDFAIDASLQNEVSDIVKNFEEVLAGSPELEKEVTAFVKAEVIPYIEAETDRIAESGDLSNLENDINELERNALKLIADFVFEEAKSTQTIVDETLKPELTEFVAHYNVEVHDPEIAAAIIVIVGPDLLGEALNSYDIFYPEALKEEFTKVVNDYLDKAGLAEYFFETAKVIIEDEAENDDKDESDKDADEENKDESDKGTDEDDKDESDKEADEENKDESDKGTDEDDKDELDKDADKDDKDESDKDADKLSNAEIEAIDALAAEYAKTFAVHPDVYEALDKFATNVFSDEKLILATQQHMEKEIWPYIDEQVEIINENTETTEEYDEALDALLDEMSSMVLEFLVGSEEFNVHLDQFTADVELLNDEIYELVNKTLEKDLLVIVSENLLDDAKAEFDSRFASYLEEEIANLLYENFDIEGFVEKVISDQPDEEDKDNTDTDENSGKPNSDKDAGKPTTDKTPGNADTGKETVVAPDPDKNDGNLVTPQPVVDDEEGLRVTQDKNTVVVGENGLETDNPMAPKTGDGSIEKVASPLTVTLMALLAAFVLVPSRLFKRKKQY